MQTEITHNLTDILTSISELQENLLNVPGAENALERLCSIRKTALTALELDGPVSVACQGYRQETLEKIDALGVMIELENDIYAMPDSTMFRIAAAADSLARSAHTYLQVRNMRAAERSRMLMAPDVGSNNEVQ